MCSLRGFLSRETAPTARSAIHSAGAPSPSPAASSIAFTAYAASNGCRLHATKLDSHLSTSVFPAASFTVDLNTSSFSPFGFSVKNDPADLKNPSSAFIAIGSNRSPRIHMFIAYP